MNTYDRIKAKNSYKLSKEKTCIRTIDMHTGGEPLRVIIDGFPSLKGNSVLEYRKDCLNNHDHLRKTLLFEPRGHADMYACLLTPPNDKGADFGVIFMHNEGYSTMCGHAIIALSTLAAEMEWIALKEGENEIKIDAPCGRIQSYVEIKDGKVKGVRFLNVESFVLGLDRTINIPSLGKINYDLAYGGAFYAYVDMQKHVFDFDLTTASYNKLITAGRLIKKFVQNQDKEILHPYEADLSFLYGCIFTGAPLDNQNNSRNVCVFADGEVDRCPTGSGVSGRMAIHRARKQLKPFETMKIESIINSVFEASYIEEKDFGNFSAVIPQVKGNAYITGQHEFIIDPNDELKTGFFLK